MPETGSGSAPAWKVDGALSVVVLLWALNFVILKTVVASIHPLGLAGLRFACIAALFEILFRLRYRPPRPRVAREDRWAFLVSALFGYSLYQAGFILGLDQTSAFSTALMINTGPAWAAVLLWATRIEPVRGRQWAGIALALLGLVVYVGPKLRTGGGAGLGDLLALGAAVSWTLHGILNKPLLRRYEALHLTTRTLQAGALVFAPLAVAPMAGQDWRGIPWQAWVGVVYSILFPVTVAVTLWNWAIGQRGVGRTVVYQYTVPVASGVLSWTLLGEEFGRLKVAGGMLVFLGVALSRRR